MEYDFVGKRCIMICLCLLLTVLFFRMFTLGSASSNAEKWLYSYMDDLSRSEDDPPYMSLHYRLRTLYFSVAPRPAKAIVFVGDSMTDEGDWSRLFPQANTANRGIGGDTTLGLLNRLDTIVDLKPDKVFLMIGTNDLCFNRSIEDTIESYNQVLKVLHEKLPHSAIYIESVLPFNDEIFPSVYLRTNANILQLNDELRQLAQKYGDTYIDLVPAFHDETGRLPKELTSDGLHLNERGYELWRQQLEPFVVKKP